MINKFDIKNLISNAKQKILERNNQEGNTFDLINGNICICVLLLFSIAKSLDSINDMLKEL